MYDYRWIENDFLMEVEQVMGLNSLRADAFAKFEQKNAIGWSSYQEIPEEHWITSNILRSILNVNRFYILINSRNFLDFIYIFELPLQASRSE